MKKPPKTSLKVPATKPTRGRPKDAVKCEDIIRAASGCFFKDGYELTSMDAVARKADVSKITIYSHFANKEELFKAVIQERCDKRAMPESFMALQSKSIGFALTQIATSMMELFYSPETIRMQRLMQAEATRHPKVVQIFYEAGPKRVREAFGVLLKTWNDEGRLTTPDIPRATDQFFSLLKGERLSKTLFHMMPQPEPAEVKKHVDATVAFYLTAYKPKSAKDLP